MKVVIEISDVHLQMAAGTLISVLENEKDMKSVMDAKNKLSGLSETREFDFHELESCKNALKDLQIGLAVLVIINEIENEKKKRIY